ncbi:MAG: hypothetical protein AAGC44_03545 [Planctomycetota bacterium]
MPLGLFVLMGMVQCDFDPGLNRSRGVVLAGVVWGEIAGQALPLTLQMQEQGTPRQHAIPKAYQVDSAIMARQRLESILEL